MSGLGRWIPGLFLRPQRSVAGRSDRPPSAPARAWADEDLQRWYRRLNRELFGGELPDLPVRFASDLEGILGKAYFVVLQDGRLEPTRISLSRRHPWSARFLRKVLVHEMVHVWSYEVLGEAGHGPRFWGKLEQLGYPPWHTWPDAGPHERAVD